MSTFENKQKVKLLALERKVDSNGSSKSSSYRYISFVDIYNEVTFLIIDCKLLMNVKSLKDYLVDNNFPPKEADLYGNKIKNILSDKPSTYVDFVMKPGYVNDAYLNSDGRVIRKVGKVGLGPLLYPKANFQISNQSQSGTLDDWQKKVAYRTKYSPSLMLSLCTALSGYILRFSDVESGGFHFYGASSIGKSTCLKFAAAVCGSSNYVNSWSITEAAFEEVAAGHNDSALILDELNLLDKDPKIAAQRAMKLVYSATSGQGKKRSRAYDDGPISWRVSLLSSGESSLNEYALSGGRERLAGEAVRLVDVPADMGEGLGIFESLPLRYKGSSASMAEKTNRACNKYYGTAKDAFIRYLLPRLSSEGGARKVRRDITTYIKEFLEEHGDCDLEGQRLRIAKRFALAYAAGALAVDAKVLLFSKDKIMRGISTCFKVAIESQPLSLSQLVARAKKELDVELMKMLESSLCYVGASSFEEAEQTPCYRTSIKKYKVLALKPQRFRELVSDEKVFKALVKEYISDDVLLLSADGKVCRQPPSGKKGFTLSRRYCFLIDELKK